MKICIQTIELYEGREYLMPWRTVLEVAQGMQSVGHEVCVLNQSNGDVAHCQGQVWNGIKIIHIESGYKSLVDVAKDADAVFIQVTWRDGLKDLQALKELKARKFVYFTGGVYDGASAMMLVRSSGFHDARPYIVESFTPKCLLTKKLKQVGIEKAICQTPYTAECSKKAGLSISVPILTGKDEFEELHPDESLLTKYGLKGKKWMLFTGAPAATRGACELLRAIDIAKEKDLRVVMLMRTDVGSDYVRLNSIYEKMRYLERVVFIRERLTRQQLKAFFETAYYGILPFIVIPSEIPVTYLEMMSCGTPIITFRNGGTTEYLKEGLWISNKSITSLSRTLDDAWKSDSTRTQKSFAALKIMNLHPTWDKVASQWMQLL